MRGNMETTERRDGYPAARVLDGGRRESDRLISAHAEPGDTVRLDIINPQSGELKSWSVSRDTFYRLASDATHEIAHMEWENAGPSEAEADANPCDVPEAVNR